MMTYPAPPRGRTRQRADRSGCPAGPASLTDEQLAGRVMSPLARCSAAAADPDEWFPVAAVVTAARAEAQRALAACAACPVRADCLELSLRQWGTIGKHGIWGGLVEAERAAVHRAWLAGAEVTGLLARPAGLAGEAPGLAGVPAAGHAAEPVRASGAGGSRRTPRRPAGARAAGKPARRRGPRGASALARPLAEQSAAD
jgi:hypothetical protein